MKFEGIDDENDIDKIRVKARTLSVALQSLEGENAVLLATIQRLTRELADATDRDRQQALSFQIKRLNEQLAAKNKELFGKSRSERRGRPGGEAGADPKVPKKQKGHGPNPQSRLPITEVLHKLDEADRICPDCEGGEPLVDMPGQTEDAIQITVVERRVVRVLNKRQKSHCVKCGHIDTALGPKPLVPGGRYTPELAVAVAVDKYSDHLPLERQVTRFEREGLEITSQTLWDLLLALYALLLPTYLALQEYLLTQPVLGADESTWRVMGKGPSARWWVWALTGMDAVFYLLAPTRGAAAARALLHDYAGILLADGYTVYKSLEQQGKLGVQMPLPKKAEPKQLAARVVETTAKVIETKAETETAATVGGATPAAAPLPWFPKFTLSTCWMHARRGFIQAEKNHPAAGEALDLIAGLYAVEDRVDAEAAGDPERALELRRQLRDTESRPLVAKLKVWAEAQKPTPKLKLDDALGYLRNQWPWLIRFLEDPRIPLDNGASERRMRGPVLGRKNHYGSRSEQGTRVAALMYSLVESCKMLDIDPGAYLREATRRAMDTRGSVLLPHVFAAELAAAAAETAAAEKTAAEKSGTEGAGTVVVDRVAPELAIAASVGTDRIPVEPVTAVAFAAGRTAAVVERVAAGLLAAVGHLASGLRVAESGAAALPAVGSPEITAPETASHGPGGAAPQIVGAQGHAADQ